MLPPPAIVTTGGDFGFRTNGFSFSLSGIAGQRLIIETSTNLINWVAIATNTLGPTPLLFTDPGSALFPYRFLSPAETVNTGKG